MNSMLLSLFMASVLAQQPAPKAQAPAAPAVQETPVSANVKLRIGTSTYFPDGRVLTTSANDWPLAINKKIVAFTGGKSMCEPRAAGLDRPELPASGWQIEFTPIREAAGELEVLVSWRSLGLAKQATFDRIRVGNGTTLKLHAGDRIVLDHTDVTFGGEIAQAGLVTAPRVWWSRRLVGDDLFRWRELLQQPG